MNRLYFFSLPGIIFAIPYNTICKLNEIYNETLHRCMNDTDIINNTNIINNTIVSTLRRTQRTGGAEARVIRRQPTLSEADAAVRGIMAKAGGEGFTNYQLPLPNSHILLIIFIGFIAYNYLPPIKKIFR